MNCSKCGINPRNPSKSGRVHSWCKPCLAEDQRSRRADWPEHNKKLRQASARRKIRDIVQKVRQLKTKPCMDCGQCYPFYVMHFDHRDPETKIKAVATLARNTVAWSRVEAEIAKCDLVCANCHAERTWQRKESK